MASITLTVLSGLAAGSTCTKDTSKPIRVGRVKTGNALVVKDSSVSSKHLEITWSDGDWFALDLGSSNGTRLNESQVPMMADQTYKLRDKDKLQLGPETLIQVHIQEAAAAADAMTVEEKLLADAERLAASIQAAAEASQQQLRDDWQIQRRRLQAIVQG